MAPLERFITLGGSRFHYLEWGDPADPPLLLVHGGGSSARGTWMLTAPALVGRFHILAPDHRGHGESDWDPDAGYSLGGHADDLTAFVTALDLPPLFAVGHSMGAFILLAYAAEHAAALRSLVLVDAAPRFGDPPTRRANPWTERPLVFASREEAESYARSRFPEAARGRPVGYGFIDLPDGTATWRTDIAGLKRAWDRAEQPDPVAVGMGRVFADLPVPVLVLRGGASDVISADDMQRLRSANPRATVRSYERAHHWLHQDEPARFADDVLQFFGQEAPRPGDDGA